MQRRGDQHATSLGDGVRQDVGPLLHSDPHEPRFWAPNRRGGTRPHVGTPASRDVLGKRGGRDTDPARVLFLSGSLGKGHDSVAAACASALSKRGIESQILDCMELLGDHSGQIGSWVFRQAVSSAWYDAFHFGHLRGSGCLGDLAGRAATRRIVRHLGPLVDLFRPDLVVPVFATGVGAAVQLKKEGRLRRIVVFVPDSMAHRLWVHDAVDLFLVTSKLAAASVRKYWPEAPVRIVEHPVRPEFLAAPGRDQARELLGVDPSACCVLLAAGAWGMGPLREFAEALAARGYTVLAMAGSNAALRRELEVAAARSPNVIPIGYTDQVSTLMAASDVIVTTSGGTCSEARAVGRAIVLLDVVPGHGRENVLHQVELGGANLAVATPLGVSLAVDAAMRNTPGDPWSSTGRESGPGTFVAALEDFEVMPIPAGTTAKG